MALNKQLSAGALLIDDQRARYDVHALINGRIDFDLFHGNERIRREIQDRADPAEEDDEE